MAAESRTMNPSRNLLQGLTSAIENTNNLLIANLTSNNADYYTACIRTDSNYGFYEHQLKKEWNSSIDAYFAGLMNDSSSSSRTMFKKILTLCKSWYFHSNWKGSVTIVLAVSNLAIDGSGKGEKSDPWIYQYFYDKWYSANTGNSQSGAQRNVDSLQERCTDAADSGTGNDVLDDTYLSWLLTTLNDFLASDIIEIYVLNGIVDKLVSKMSTTPATESEQVSSVHQFFRRLVHHYYEHVHCIIWANVLLEFLNDIFVVRPSTRETLLEFIQYKVIVCSGPFINKTIQQLQTSPASHQLGSADRLFPLMTKQQVKMILSRAIKNFARFKIVKHTAATIGHICQVVRIDKPDKIFVLKIIKPLSVTISCWEYMVALAWSAGHLPPLMALTNRGACKSQECHQQSASVSVNTNKQKQSLSLTLSESRFVNRILQRNGQEMLATNEIDNILKGFKHYDADYKEIFDYDLPCKVTTVKYISDVVKPRCWYVVPMTKAKGMSLSQLLASGSKYSKNALHRTLDLLIYKYFFTIFMSKDGFFHKELHLDNLFYSDFGQGSKDARLTIIDFGTIGHIDFFSDEAEIQSIIVIAVRLWWHNYDEMFDELASLMSLSRNDDFYKFRDRMAAYKRQVCMDEVRDRENKNDYFSKEWMSWEQQNYKVYAAQAEAQPEQRQSQKKKNRAEYGLYDSLDFVAQVDNGVRDAVRSTKSSRPYPVAAGVANKSKKYKSESGSNSNKITSIQVINECLAYGASQGIVMPVQYPIIYELERSYSFLTDVLSKTGYDTTRIEFIFKLLIKRSSVPWKHLNKLFKMEETMFVVGTWKDEENKYEEYLESFG